MQRYAPAKFCSVISLWNFATGHHGSIYTVEIGIRGPMALLTVHLRTSWRKCQCRLNWRVQHLGASQVVLVIKNLPANAGDVGDVGSIPWRRAWLPTPAFLSGESHGQRSLASYIQSMGSQRVGHNWSDLALVFCSCSSVNSIGNWIQIQSIEIPGFKTNYPHSAKK